MISEILVTKKELKPILNYIKTIKDTTQFTIPIELLRPSIFWKIIDDRIINKKTINEEDKQTWAKAFIMHLNNKKVI